MERCCNCFEEFDGSIKCPHCGYEKGMPPKELSHLYPGTELAGRYIIGETVGFGGFGVTYKAWDKKLELVVAVKEYYPSGIVNRTPGTNEVVIYARKRKKEYDFGKARFLDEARNMAKFSSEPNIINVFEYFEENNTAYIVMEFLAGLSLSAFIHSADDVIDVDTGIEIAETIGNALTKIHAKGIVHRDVSPDNIFLCVGGGMKLIDFGAARFSQDENKMMTIILKPGFAPPEQYEKINEQGPWTDVYALGATLYYVLTGIKPEESTNRKIKDQLQYPHELNRKIPVNLSNAIMKAMAIDLHLRYRSVDEFLAAIHSDKKVVSIETEKKRKRNKRLIGIGAVAAVLVIGISVSAVNWKKEKDSQTLPDCTISMWYCKSGDDVLDAAEQAAYEAIISDFNSSFPNVTVELIGFDKDEYKQALASDDGKPGIYEYIGTTADETLDLEAVYKSESAKNCSVLSFAEDHFQNRGLLPLGFNVPVIFENTVISDIDISAVASLSDISADALVTDYELFAKSLTGAVFDISASQKFIDGDEAFYGTFTDKYYVISNAMPAQYKLLPVDIDRVYCTYDNIWAACDNGKDCNKAEVRLLEFMLSNNAQDALHIRNQSTSLPINDDVLAVYESINPDFEDFFDNSDKYVFE